MPQRVTVVDCDPFRPQRFREERHPVAREVEALLDTSLDVRLGSASCAGMAGGRPHGSGGPGARLYAVLSAPIKYHLAGSIF